MQTEQSAALEVEIGEQKELNRQLFAREKDMKHYVQALQQELEKRSNEAVVSAARLREVESRLAEIQPPETTEPPPLSPTQQQLEDEPEYKSENITSFSFVLSRHITLCTLFYKFLCSFICPLHEDGCLCHRF